MSKPNHKDAPTDWVVVRVFDADYDVRGTSGASGSDQGVSFRKCYVCGGTGHG